MRIAADSFQAILRDVSERKHTETERKRLFTELEEHAIELDSIINSIADGFVIYNADGEILRINEAALRILGYSPAEQQLSSTERFALLHAETPDGAPFPFELFPMEVALRATRSSG